MLKNSNTQQKNYQTGMVFDGSNGKPALSACGVSSRTAGETLLNPIDLRTFGLLKSDILLRELVTGFGGILSVVGVMLIAIMTTSRIF